MWTLSWDPLRYSHVGSLFLNYFCVWYFYCLFVYRYFFICCCCCWSHIQKFSEQQLNSVWSVAGEGCGWDAAWVHVVLCCVALSGAVIVVVLIVRKMPFFLSFSLSFLFVRDSIRCEFVFVCGLNEFGLCGRKEWKKRMNGIEWPNVFRWIDGHLDGWTDRRSVSAGRSGWMSVFKCVKRVKCVNR